MRPEGLAAAALREGRLSDLCLSEGLVAEGKQVLLIPSPPSLFLLAPALQRAQDVAALATHSPDTVPTPRAESARGGGRSRRTAALYPEWRDLVPLRTGWPSTVMLLIDSATLSERRGMKPTSPQAHGCQQELSSEASSML